MWVSEPEEYYLKESRNALSRAEYVCTVFTCKTSKQSQFLLPNAEEEDRFILCMVHKLGYGCWEELKAEIRNSWRFRFDWFFKSRTPMVRHRTLMASCYTAPVSHAQHSFQLQLALPAGIARHIQIIAFHLHNNPNFIDTCRAFVQELSRRCDTLIRLVEKENEEMEAAEKEERKKTTKKTDSKPSETSGGAAKKRKASSGSGAPAKKRSIAA